MGNKLYDLTDDAGKHLRWCFVCPACRAIHQVDDRWWWNGDRERPTFQGHVLVRAVPEIDQPRCRSFIIGGTIRYDSDSTHAMAGQVEELPDWDDDHPLGGAER